ncbi:MAG: cupin domain-containing protein [Solirubrobacterales bacterium]
MASLEVKNFDSPDETRPFEGKGKAEVVMIGGKGIARGTFEPGWKWSENVKPIAGTDSCEVAHLGYVLSGRMVIKMDDGDEQEVGPGDVAAIPPGHDAEVPGDEACVLVDFGEISEYAKRD